MPIQSSDKIHQEGAILVSNELEFCLDGTNAADVIRVGKSSGLNIVHEVNPRDVVEVNVSMKRNIEDLNFSLAENVRILIEGTDSIGGRIYGGSSLLTDVSDVEPRAHRTTTLSRRCGREFLDITSQQIILGAGSDVAGFKIYNFFRRIGPVLLALSASSPYSYDKTELKDTCSESRRPEKYELVCQSFPPEMWRGSPEVNSLAEYEVYRRRISEEVKRRLESGELDSDWEELYKRNYAPFDILEPHQIYWPVRLRPDHNTVVDGMRCPFSIELRVPDIPTTVSRMQAVNAFIIGLARFISENEPPQVPDYSFDDLKTAAKYGIDARLNGSKVGDHLKSLSDISSRGLREAGYDKEAQRLQTYVSEIFEYGNDARLIRGRRPADAEELINYLTGRLRRRAS